MFRKFAICLAIVSGPATAGVPTVATDIAAVHSLAAQVMQGVGEPYLIIQHGASPHDYRLRPSEAAALASADVVFWIGPELTPWLGSALPKLAPEATEIALIETPETTVLPVREAAVFGNRSDDREHDEGTRDPHAWFDPENAKVWLDVIAEELAKADPANSDAYSRNAARAQARIETVSAEIGELIAPLRSREFIVFHDAFQYVEARFALSAAGAISFSDATDPSAARISEIRSLVASQDIACAFAEPQFNPGLLATVLEGTGTQSAIVDPVGTDITPGPDFYPTLLRRIAGQIADCLAGGS